MVRKFGEISAEKSLYGSLMDMLDSKDPLVVLADTIKWSEFEDEFAITILSKMEIKYKPIV